MTLRITLFAALSSILMGAVGSAQDVVLFDQPPVVVGNPATGPTSFASTLSVMEDDNTVPNRTYDNFTLTSNSTLTALGWQGGFNGVFHPELSFRSEVDFEVTVFGDQLGRPDIGNVVFSQVYDAGLAGLDVGTDVQKAVVPDSLLQAGEFTGTNGIVLDYALPLDSVELGAGDYWLSIRALMSFPSEPEDFVDPAWAWLASESGDSLVYNYDEDLDPAEPGFRVTASTCASAGLAGCDAAFTLIGTQDSLFGDFDNSGFLDIPDIDMLAAAIRSGDTDLMWDVNQDGSVTDADHQFWVTDVKKTLPGDANLDFSVAFNDFLQLSRGFGLPGGWGEGNFGTDEEVGFADFLALSRNFGNSVAPAQSVPEPSAQFLFCLALTALVGGARKRR